MPNGTLGIRDFAKSYLLFIIYQPDTISIDFQTVQIGVAGTQKIMLNTTS